MLCLLCWREGSVGELSPFFLRLLSGQKPLETFGDVAGAWGTLPVVLGRRISRMALAPQLILLANGLVGLADAGPSVSSIAHSSALEADEEFDDTDPRLSEKLVCNCGGEVPLIPDTLIRRLWFAWAAAEVIGPGYAGGGCGWRLALKNSERDEPAEMEARRSRGLVLSWALFRGDDISFRVLFSVRTILVPIGDKERTRGLLLSAAVLGKDGGGGGRPL